MCASAGRSRRPSADVASPAVVAALPEDARAPAVVLDEAREGLAARAAAGPDVARGHLVLGDVGVQVEYLREQLVGRVPGDQAAAAPVVGQADLVDRAAVDAQRLDAIGDHHARLDRRARGDDRRPVTVLERALLREL